jgi:Tfp pilus assembly protein PilX
MKQTHLRDERGVALVLELVLVAAVLGLVGLAVYQATRRPAPQTSTTSVATPAPNSAAGLAASAAAITTQDTAADTSASAAADNIVGEVVSSDADISNLGGASNAGSF